EGVCGHFEPHRELIEWVDGEHRGRRATRLFSIVRSQRAPRELKLRRHVLLLKFVPRRVRPLRYAAVKEVPTVQGYRRAQLRQLCASGRVGSSCCGQMLSELR